MSDKNRIEKNVEEAALEGAAAESVQRFGSAIKEHIVSYTGSDKEYGKELKRSLKSISESKVDENFRKQNIKQQAGFSAEVKSSARKTADSIINREGSRTLRYDDFVPGSNDQIIDVISVDELGNIIPDSAAQMKFVGKTASEMLDRLRGQKFHKYLETNVKLSVPDDFYDELMGNDGLINIKIKDLQEQLNKATQKGKTETAEKIKKQIDDCKIIKNKLTKSGLTNEEAIFAREHPQLSAAQDIGKIALQTGTQQATTGAVISGSISLIKNAVSYIKGDIDAKELGINVAKDSAKGAAFSFVTATSGSVIKGAMQNSADVYVRGLSRTNLPASFVSTAKDVATSIIKYMRGEVTGAECIEEMGEHGFGQLGASMYSTLAIAAVKGTSSVATKVIAGMVGSTCGYAAAVAVYQEIATSLKEYQFAKEQRIVIEAECKQIIQMIDEYRMEMNETVEKYMTDHLQAFGEGIENMDKAIIDNDVDGFIQGNAEIQRILGQKIQFSNFEEFDDLMLSDSSFEL